MKRNLIALAASVALPLAACTAESDPAGPQEAGSMMEAVEGNSLTTDVAAALSATGLSGVFDGPGGYTLLAPANGSLSVNEGEEALVAAVLREHILPGQLDSASIRSAIETNGGPVTVSTFGSGTVEFSLDGDVIVARHSGGTATTRLAADETITGNGALLQIDQPLVSLPAEEPAAN
ncbi:fasciclin domain-containing protein [Erythrobacter sp. HKB08]|uniref:fasciclin domain-containing protein n=1 Tax=Erythrobacter sp. HKB08 TaxID=2502843 RepID=UPI001008B4EB|nr:fasciclin domain-containing protein [Erythrobacter sp. HKB08]